MWERAESPAFQPQAPTSDFGALLPAEQDRPWLVAGAALADGRFTRLDPQGQTDEQIGEHVTELSAGEIGVVAPNRATINDLIRTSGQWIAVGSEQVDGLWEPRIWRSDDGRDWTRSIPELPGEQLRGSWGLALRAIGQDETGGLVLSGGDLSGTRLWTSSGHRWLELALPAEVDSSVEVSYELVAMTGGTLLLADGEGGNPVLLRRDAAGAFQEPSAATEVFGRRGEWLTAQEVVADPEGGLLAVGARDRPGPTATQDASPASSGGPKTARSGARRRRVAPWTAPS